MAPLELCRKGELALRVAQRWHCSIHGGQGTALGMPAGVTLYCTAWQLPDGRAVLHNHQRDLSVLCYVHWKCCHRIDVPARERSARTARGSEGTV